MTIDEEKWDFGVEAENIGRNIEQLSMRLGRIENKIFSNPVRRFFTERSNFIWTHRIFSVKFFVKTI